MVVIQCDDKAESCEIKLKLSGSVDLDCYISDRKHKSKSRPIQSKVVPSESREQRTRILRSISSSERDTSAADDDVARFLSQVGDPKECRKLTLVRVGSKFSVDCHQVNNPFPVAALTKVVQQAKQLVCLELCWIRLVGTMEEFAAFARAIESLPYLQAFSMEHCRLNKKAAKESALEPVVRALVSCLCLCDVTLIADKPNSLGSLSIDTVGFLGRSPSLQILRLDKLGLVDSHVAELAQALKANVMLQTLRLSCSVDDHGSFSIVQMLEHNKNIQTFDLFLETVHSEESTLRIAGALQASASLKHYSLDFGSKNLSSRLLQVQNEVIETKALARELEFSSTRLSNCPFIRLLNGAIDASIYFGGIACSPKHGREKSPVEVL